MYISPNLGQEVVYVVKIAKFQAFYACTYCVTSKGWDGEDYGIVLINWAKIGVLGIITIGFPTAGKFEESLM